MPRINRIRIVNVVYDKGTKTFANELFTLNGENTLFNLVNGGGKTVLLQLLMQCVLPNTDLGRERKFEHFFADGRRTSHILVEWRLDSAHDQFLLTGLCATRVAAEDQELRYFTHTHEYHHENPLDIERIPVVGSDRTVADYQSFHKLLDKQQGFKIKTFRSDERRRYIEHLQSYNLLEEEWQTTRTINLTEGGIAKFFEKAQTSRKFVEEILIRYVEDILHGRDETKRNALANIFDKHVDNLTRIPELRQSIQLYDSFLVSSERIISEVQRYDDLRGSLQQMAGSLIAYRNHAQREVDQCQHQLIELQYRVDQCKQEERRLRCRKDSYALYLQRQRLAAVAEELTRQLAKITEHEQWLGQRKRQIDLFKVAQWLMNKRQKESDLAAARTKLHALQQSEGDSRAELNRCLWSLRRIYENELGMVQQRLELWQKQLQDLKSELDSLVSQQREAERQLSDLRGQIGKCEGETKRYHELFNLVEERYGLPALMAFTETLEKSRQQLELTKRSITDRGEELQQLITEEKDLEVARERLEHEREQVGRQSYDADQRLVKYREHLSAVETELSKYEIPLSSLFNGLAERTLVVKKGEYQRKLKELQMTAAKLHEQRLLVEDRDFYVADADILQVEKQLEELELTVVTGSQWLADIADEQMRSAYISTCPWLPYGVLISGADMEKLSKIGGLPQLELNSLVPIIVKESLQHVGPGASGEVLAAEGGHVYFLNHGGNELFISDQSFAAYKERLDRHALDLDAQITQVEQTIAGVQRSLQVVADFLGEYNADSLRHLQSAKDTLDGQLEKLRQAFDANKQAVQQLQRTQARIRELIDQDKEARVQQEEALRQLEELQREKQVYQDTMAKKAFLEAQARSLHDQLQALHRLVEKTHNTQGELRLQLRDGEEDAKKLQGLLRGITLDKSFAEAYPGDHRREDLEGIRRGLEDSLGRSGQDTSDLQDRITDLTTGIEESEASRAELSITWDEVADLRWPGDAAMGQMRQELRQREALLKDDQEQRQQYREARSTLTERVRNSESRIRSEYQMEPVQDFDEDIDVEKAINMSLQQVELQRRGLEGQSKQLEDQGKEYERHWEKAEEFIAQRDIDTVEGCSQWQPVPVERLASEYQHLTSSYSDYAQRLHGQKGVVDKAYESLATSFGQCSEAAIRQFVLSIDVGADVEALYIPSAVADVFDQCREAVLNLKLHCQHSLAEADKQREELTIRCYQYAERVLNEITAIDGKSAIRIGERSQKMVRIELDNVGRELYPDRMARYIDECIETVKGEYDDNLDRNKLLTRIKELMSTVKLLGVISDLDKSRVQVFKPHTNSAIGSRYESWEAVVSFSGGEKYTCFFAMYSSLLSYIRGKKVAGKSHKVILADNPFGTTSAGHLLKIIFAMVEKYDTQIICFTGLKEMGIYQHFHRVYSLVLRNTLDGRQRISSELIENRLEIEAGHVSFEQQLSLM